MYKCLAQMTHFAFVCGPPFAQLSLDLQDQVWSFLRVPPPAVFQAGDLPRLRPSRRPSGYKLVPGEAKVLVSRERTPSEAPCSKYSKTTLVMDGCSASGSATGSALAPVPESVHPWTESDGSECSWIMAELGWAFDLLRK